MLENLTNSIKPLLKIFPSLSHSFNRAFVRWHNCNHVKMISEELETNSLKYNINERTQHFEIVEKPPKSTD